MKKNLFSGAVGGVLIFALIGVANAIPITINISADIAYIDDQDGLLGGSIDVGDVINGHYTYDLITPDSNPFDSVGDYWHYDSSYGITLSCGGFIFKTDPLNTNFLVEIVDDHYSGNDNYLLRSYNNLPVSNELFVEHIGWQLDDDTMTALSSVDLTASPPNLPDWQSLFGLTITGGNAVDPYSDPYSDQFFIRAHVTSAEIASALVPEPSTMLLICIGIAGLAGFKRKII